MMRILAALAVAALAIAGCTTPSGSETSHDSDVPSGHQHGAWPSGKAARDLIESYIMTHPFRVQQTGFESYMASARDDLAAHLEAIEGLHVVRDDYDGGQNILAFHNGTTAPHEWVVLSAHYDTVGAGGVGPTVYGAWDDGAGVALLMDMAAVVATWDLPFTVVFAFFDGEEKGLVGSQRFVETFFEDGTHDLVANLNTDPPGLNWPCGDPAGPFAVKVIHNEEKVADPSLPRYAWLKEAVAYGIDATGIPAEAMDYTAGIPIATAAGAGLRGTSDHARFDEVDVANVFLGGVPLTIVNGDPNENTAAVLTYSFHTPLDTLQQMEARCVEGSLAGGLQTIADIFAHTLVWMAEHHAAAGTA